MDTLSGSIERIVFYNPENGYSVVRLKPDREQDYSGAISEGAITITGNLPELTAGEYIRLRGNWSRHSKHGLQFQVEYCEQTLPATIAGIRRYLGSGLIKGIGPRLAERIVAHFGIKTLEIIEDQPNRLQEAPDIGPKRADLIATAWQEQKQVKEIMLFLHSHQVSTNLAIKIYKTYGDQALDVVKNDPYRLARDIYGVGFKTADRIAQALGLPPEHPSRMEAGVVYLLNQMNDDGHVYSPRQVLVEGAAELLGVAQQLIPPALERLAQQDLIRTDIVPIEPGSSAETATLPHLAEVESNKTYGQAVVYLTTLYQGETGVAERLRKLAEARAKWSLPANLHLPELSATERLSPEQQEAIRVAMVEPVSVLTGGPGTGKTTTLKVLISLLEAARKRYALASPTGRAAKRLSEATGRPASTIHRLLGYNPGEGFKYNASNPLPVDLLVVDEASMLDLMLAFQLLRALRPGTHLLLVGDVDQLPSVGAGDVLRDIIHSGIAPVTRLSVIFRQAAGSHIITNAHRINQGQIPVFSQAQAIEGQASSGDFFFFPAETPEQAADWVIQVVCERIPRKFNLHPRHQVQVLSPMYRGPAGVNALNMRLQEALNPPETHKAEKSLFEQVFRVGDKVMQTRNNYDKDVYNGDIGWVDSLDLIEHTLTVNFEDKRSTYDWSETDQLVLAYAISVHKSQGSEFPAVVIPLVTQHYMMLQRNLLYTAITRARRLCVLVGSPKAIAIAVKNNKVSQRYTALKYRLGKNSF